VTPGVRRDYGRRVTLRIQHVGLVVSDLERSRRFYREALGLEEVPRPSSFTFDGAWFRFGGTEIHLLAEAHTTGGAGQGDPGAGAARGLTQHLAFEVDDLAASLERLDASGVPLAGGPMPRGDGVVQAFFRDPDGYVLELFQWTDEDQSDAPDREPVGRE
jgi:catechol 2,3-dioxygenase-like lactoylglutathione lyase family enzyme